MFKKLASFLVTAALAVTGLAFTASAPAQAAAPATGSIYYIGGWNMGDALNDPFWTGFRRFDPVTGDDIRLDLETPSCAGLAGSSTTGLAVDIAHKRIYWTANDGVAGVFAMDLVSGNCYMLQDGGSPRGIVFSPDGMTVIWSEREYDPNRGIRVQQLRTNQVADLEVASSPNAVNGVIEVDIPGYNDISISDLEMKNGRMYALMNLTDNIDLSTRNFIYSYDPTSLADTPTLESETGVIGSPYQFQIGENAYYVSTYDQIYKVEFGTPGAVWGMMLDQVAGFALIGDTIYSAFTRDTPMKKFNVLTSTEPEAISSNPPVDMMSYLVYAEPMPVPVISATASKTTGGTVDVPYTGVTIGTNEVLGYSITPQDGGAPFGGVCTIVNSKCRITGLDDAKIYDLTLRYAYTYLDAGAVMHVSMASAPSNQVVINEPVVNPPPPPTPSKLKAIKTVTGFEFEAGTLTAATKKSIRTWLTGKTGYTKVTCVGYTGYNYFKRSNAFLTKLALKRATNVCNYIHKLNPSIVVKAKTAKNQVSKKSSTRRVIATITN